MTPDTVEGFDIDLIQTPITPGFLTVTIRTNADLGQGYFSELRFANTGNDPVWFGTVIESAAANTYFFFGGQAIWSYSVGAPGFFLQGSLYDLEWVR